MMRVLKFILSRFILPFVLMALAILCTLDGLAQPKGGQPLRGRRPTSISSFNPQTSRPVASRTWDRNNLPPLEYNTTTLDKDPDDGPPPPPQVPVDQGIVFLFLAGAGLGVYQVKKKYCS